jgi:RecB family exonuclease
MPYNLEPLALRGPMSLPAPPADSAERRDLGFKAPAVDASADTAQADQAQLISAVRGWRRHLVENLAPQDQALDRGNALTTVMRLLDRLLFLRICEARGTEPSGGLLQMTRQADVAAAVAQGLREVAQRTGAEPLELGPVPSDDALMRTITDMVRPDPPIRYDKLPADILASLHEQLIGEAVPGEDVPGTVRTTQRRKSGVYYTPLAIVEHVVAHALAPTIIGKTPAQMRRIRVLDPACGGGSFLLVAYQTLLDAHLNWYVSAGPDAWLDKPEPTVARGCDGAMQLTIDERLRILTSCIFGVDIDPRAVEVTRLSLLLKALDVGQGPAMTKQQQLFAPRSRPLLTANIHRGNALIGDDFDAMPTDETGGALAGDPVVPMNWKHHFGHVAPDGFDVVIGNPPWGQKGIAKDKAIKAYIQRSYPSAKGIYDLFRPFVEKGVGLLRTKGRFGMVLPDIVLLKSYAPTRELLLDSLAMTHIDWWGMAFPDAVIDAVTILGEKKTAGPRHRVAVAVHDADAPVAHAMVQADFRKNLDCTFNLMLTDADRALLDRVAHCPRLDAYWSAHEGVHSGNMRAELFVDAAVDESCRPLIFGRDEISRYRLDWSGGFVRLSVVSVRRSPARYCNIGRPEWYAQDKLLVRRTGDYIMAAVDTERRYASNNAFVVVPAGDGGLSLDGFCALLNSPFMTWYFRTTHPRKGRVFAELKIKHLSRFPLPPADTHPSQLERLNALGAQRREWTAQEGADGTSAARLTDRIANTDAEIADCVARIFGYTEHEQLAFTPIDPPRRRRSVTLSEPAPTPKSSGPNDGLGEWVQRILNDETGSGERLPTTLVLCRTNGIADSLRRAIARRGGALGVEITTPLGMATLAADPGVVRGGDPPADNPLIARIGGTGERPGLESGLAEWVRRGRLHRLTAEGLPGNVHFPAGFDALTASRWGVDPSEAAAVHLVERTHARAGEPRKGATAAEAVDRVLAIGFPPWVRDPSALPPTERRFADAWMSLRDAGAVIDGVPDWVNTVLNDLDAEYVGHWSRPIDPDSAIPTVRVPDVTAEARLCTAWLRHLTADADRSVLVLVPDATVADRLHAVAARNHLDTSTVESASYGSHALALVLRAAQPWFEHGSDNPIIRVSQLAAVLCSPAVGQHWPKTVDTDLRARIEPLYASVKKETDFRPLRLSARELRDVLRAAHIVEAPLADWLTRLDALAADAAARGLSEWRIRERRRGAILLGARLRRLELSLGARTLGPASGVEPDAPDQRGMAGGEAEDHDVSHISGVAPGTIGALRQFLMDCKARLNRDPVGRALAAALRDARDAPATVRVLNQLLSSEAQSKRLAGGIEVLSYADYDGRAVDELVLLGVHDKGLCAMPSPDPFLSDAAATALGAPTGRRAVIGNLLQALRAMANAEGCLAITCERDASGRRVVPPIELNLDEKSGTQRVAVMGCTEPVDSFGLNIGGLPEAEARGALTVAKVMAEDATTPDTPSAGAQSDLGQAAIQASCEWYRAGRGTRAPAPPPDPDAGNTLADVLNLLSPIAPDWAMPYLGAVPDGANDDAWAVTEKGPVQWSVSRHFVPLTNNLYRFFVERVLRIQDEEPVSDELDPRAVGSAVHEAFEQANPAQGVGVQWRPSAVSRDQAIEDALGVLRRETDAAIEAAKTELSLQDPAIVRATDGLRDRWNNHWARKKQGKKGEEWTGYLGTRIRARDGALEKSANDIVIKHIGDAPGVAGMVQMLDEESDFWKNQSRATAFRKWIRWALCEAVSGVDLSALDDVTLAKSGGAANLMPTTLASEDKPVMADLLRATVASPEFEGARAYLAQTLPAIEALKGAICGPATDVITELPFGTDATSTGLDALMDVTLHLGGEDHPVRGKVDRIMVVETDCGPMLQILDYKTGGGKTAGELKQGMTDLWLPQLPVYGLALREALKRQQTKGGDLGRIPRDATVAVLAYDHVRKAEGAGLVDDYLISNDALDVALGTLDALVQRGKAGQWSILPVDPDPDKHAWGWYKGAVSLEDAARFEGMPGSALSDDADEEEAE